MKKLILIEVVILILLVGVALFAVSNPEIMSRISMEETAAPVQTAAPTDQIGRAHV